MLPSVILELTSLRELYLKGNQLTALPPEIGQLTGLESLRLEGNQPTALPPEIGQLTSLESLWLEGNQLTALPPEIGQLTSLRQLWLEDNLLTALPPEIGQLTSLRQLRLDGNQLTALPPEIVQLTSLRELRLDGNQLTALPPEIVQLTGLGDLWLKGNQLTALPPEIGQLTSLKWLLLAGNQLSALPPEIGQLTSLESLWLAGNGLSALPPEIGQLTSLRELRLDGNQLSGLPREIGQLTSLRQLWLDGNQLTGLPPEIGQLTSLERLSLDGNQLTGLPPEIGQLTSLKRLSPDGLLTTLPPEIEELLSTRLRRYSPDAAPAGAYAVGSASGVYIGGEQRAVPESRRGLGEVGDGRKVFPRVEAPGVVVADREFDLTVGIAPRAVEEVAGGRFSIPRGRFTLGVQITADGFRLAPGHSWRQELTVTKKRPFPSVTLRVAAESRDCRVRASKIEVVYEVGGSVVGFGIRAVAVVDSPELLSGVAVEPEEEATVVSVAQGEPVADLTVTITYGDARGRLLWTYQSPHIRPVSEPELCDLGPGGAQDFAQMLIRQVHQREGREDMEPFLLGTGSRIADQVPDGFWPVLAEVARVTSPRMPTVLLLTEEPYVPWELALLPDPLDPALPAYLGCQVVMGRWALARRKPKLPPPPVGEAETMSVVTGVYDLPLWPRLRHAEEEALELKNTYGAMPVTADLHSVLRLLKADPLTDLVHFAVHGSADPNGIENGIILIDGKGLDPTVVRACSLHGMPFVFLNACQLGTGQEVLGDYSGMAEAFLYAGACGVVAPLWSVNDDVAKALVLAFYARVLGGERPADVLRELRCGVGSGFDPVVASALAYQFFGHPSMILRRNQQLPQTAATRPWWRPRQHPR
ncbi:MAG: leucine-rich repeat domain-containing protein [Streptosporangiaceae bacterium]